MQNNDFIAETLFTASTQFAQNYVFHAHAHDLFNHFFYIVEGTGTFTVADVTYDIHANMCVNVPKGCTHAMNNPSSPIKAKEIKYDIYDSELQACIDGIVPVFRADNLITTLTDQVLFSGTMNSRFYLPYSKHCLNALVYYFASMNARAIPTQQEVLSDALIVDRNPDYTLTSITLDLVDFIDENYAKEITLDVLSEKFKYNKSYLCLLFKQDTSNTISSYIKYVRIMRAAEIIASEQYNNLSDVAYMVGFKNASHFTKIFNQIMGMAPGQYKRHICANDVPFANAEGTKRRYIKSFLSSMPGKDLPEEEVESHV